MSCLARKNMLTARTGLWESMIAGSLSRRSIRRQRKTITEAVSSGIVPNCR
jgi:hypothetical protein